MHSSREMHNYAYVCVWYGQARIWLNAITRTRSARGDAWGPNSSRPTPPPLGAAVTTNDDYAPAESLVFEGALASTAIPIASSGVRPKRAVRCRNSMTSSRRAPASIAERRC